MGAAQEREITGTTGLKLDLLETPAHLGDSGHRSGAANLLIARQGDADAVNAGLVEPRLMPGNERHRLPAALIVNGEHGQPVAEGGHARPLAPAALLLG